MVKQIIFWKKSCNFAAVLKKMFLEQLFWKRPEYILKILPTEFIFGFIQINNLSVKSCPIGY